MRLHPSVAKVILEAAGETKITVNVYAPNPTGAGGFFPERNHPNLNITFVPAPKGKHIALAKGRTTHVQYSGEHFGGTLDQVGYARKKGCLIISAIRKKTGGRYTAILLDHIAQNGGRLMGDGYFSWKGVVASLNGDFNKATEWFTRKILSLFGVPSLASPTFEKNEDLFIAAGLGQDGITDDEGDEDDAETPAEEPIIKGKPELNPAAKVLQAAGFNFSVEKGLPFDLPKVPTDLNHQHLLQRALDDLKSDGVIDFDIYYGGGKVTRVTVQLEGVDSGKNVAIIENMMNNDLLAKPYAGKFGNGYEVTCEGVTFRTINCTDGSGEIVVVDGKVERLVGEYEKGELVEKVRALTKVVKTKGIMEAVTDYCGKPING